MYNIGICDDQIICAETFEISVMKIMKSFDIEYRTFIYTSSNEMIADLKSGKTTLDILFLDIIMNKEDHNGVETANIIRKFNDDLTIVFVSSTDEFTLEGYSVRALQYLLKPVNEEKLHDLLEYDLRDRISENTTSKNYIYFKVKESTRKVNYKDIVYIETYGRGIKVVLKNDDFISSYKISQVLEMLTPTFFIQCHQSYIVNTNYISEIKHLEIITNTEDSIPVSRSHWKEVKQIFT
ncbi:DNA-binding response regulator, LytR/AlgR family [Acetitomaculum ruminis DSM 5522]|uniref:Stage 0 sporulation protein A homolog n=1 Tax=Acetitomaculum ruminis DSM 5522 TaxID=1120918 RepID=A0A1I0V6S3_9FIRM|nr:LytTR family DNA-binding domain-containing protein [Acetitomaculum ruminis]SFA71783.1 DNA-binding response regulator, LytR/AlgR family [Acetitomaculum ruminis DSM 5522]